MDVRRYSDALLQKLQTFHSKDFLCDTIITVGQQSLKAHGVLLAAVSPFFKEALETNTEPGLHVINLTGCDFDVLEIAVQFIYTGRLKVTEKYAEPEKLEDLMNSLSDLGLDHDHLCRWDVFKCEEEEVEEEEEEEVSRCKEASKLPMTVNFHEPVLDAAKLKDKFVKDSEIQTNRSPEALGNREDDHSKIAEGIKTEQDTEQFNHPLELSAVSNRWVHKGETAIQSHNASSDILNDFVINDGENETLMIKSNASLRRGKKKLNKKAKLSGRLTLFAPKMPDVLHPPSTELPQASSSDLSQNISSHEVEGCRLSEAKKKRQRLPWKRSNIVCSVCSKVFARLDRFKIHQRIHTGELPYSCEYCGKKFAFGNNLSRHVKTHTGEKRFLCHFCGRAFIQKATLDDHMAVHTKERKHMCNFCGKFFKSSGCLRTHSRQHRGLPPRRKRDAGADPSQESSNSIKKNGATRFACQICQKDYAYKATLAIHIRQHSASKPFKCTSCEKTFWQRAHREIHERSHSGVRPYSCTLCGKTFTYSAGLKLHTRLHTGEKPYKCEFCGSCYRQQAHLRSHIRTHTGEKPFECKACGKKYRNKVDLRFHQKRNPSCIS